MPHISLVAGNGDFPRMFVRAAEARGMQVSVIGMKGEADRSLAKDMRWVDIGNLQQLIDTLKQCPATDVAFAGGIRKIRFFLSPRPDARALKVLARLVTKKDDGLLRALASELEADGLQVVPSTLYLGDAMAPEGVLTRAPTAEELADIRFGFILAKQMGAADVGQTVVVKDGMPLAIEAIEGTDACILRGGKLARQGAVVVKTLKPDQDARFDLPAIGPRTIQMMRKVKARALGVEAGQVLLIRREETLALAKKHGIAVVGARP